VFAFQVVLTLADKPQTPEDIDKIVRADVPDPVDEPTLHQLIKRMNVHRKHGPKCPPLRRGICRKGFPRRFRQETVLDDGTGMVGYR
jgi:hypothetical protein